MPTGGHRLICLRQKAERVTSKGHGQVAQMFVRSGHPQWGDLPQASGCDGLNVGSAETRPSIHVPRPPGH